MKSEQKGKTKWSNWKENERLFEAVVSMSIEQVKKRIECFELASDINPRVFVALCKASGKEKNKAYRIAQMLLEYGVDPNDATRSSFTALHLAWPELFELLADNGMKIDSCKDHFGNPCQHYFALGNDTEKLGLAIKRGADLLMLGGDGRNSLHLACKEGKARAVEMILSQLSVAQAQKLSSEGVSAIHYSATSAQFESLKCMKLLIEKGVDHNLKTIDGLSACDLLRETNSIDHSNIETLWQMKLAQLEKAELKIATSATSDIKSRVNL